MANKKEIKMELDALRAVAFKMSNVMYNLSQQEKKFNEFDRALFKRLYKEHDAIKRNK